MKDPINIAERKPIWIVLSNFYLDTDLEDYTFRTIANTILESAYTLEEVKKINKYEIFPVLQPNLLSVAGLWSGFQEEWLVTTIANRLNKRTAIKRIAVKISWAAFKWMQKHYWEKLEKTYTRLKTNPDV